jgi:hypothetical protein
MWIVKCLWIALRALLFSFASFGVRERLLFVRSIVLNIFMHARSYYCIVLVVYAHIRLRSKYMWVAQGIVLVRSETSLNTRQSIALFTLCLFNWPEYNHIQNTQYYSANTWCANHMWNFENFSCSADFQKLWCTWPLYRWSYSRILGGI